MGPRAASRRGRSLSGSGHPLTPDPRARWDNCAMGRTYEVIDERLADWLVDQPVFFVSTAPLDGDGLVNCSPKGNRHEFAVLDGRTVAFLDQTGSGVETIAHLRENGRIVVMFCAFTGPPRIVRLHGKGRTLRCRKRRVRRPGPPVSRWYGGGCALDHRRRRGPYRRLVRIWRSPDVVRRAPTDDGRMVDPKRCGRDPRLLDRAQRHQPR